MTTLIAVHNGWAVVVALRPLLLAGDGNIAVSW
jgi:hypothetical protein